MIMEAVSSNVMTFLVGITVRVIQAFVHLLQMQANVKVLYARCVCESEKGR